MNDPETKETLVKQEPRVSIDRKESVKGDVSWNISIAAPLTDEIDTLINRIANARIHAYVKEVAIQAAKPKTEGSK